MLTLSAIAILVGHWRTRPVSVFNVDALNEKPVPAETILLLLNLTMIMQSPCAGRILSLLIFLRPWVCAGSVRPTPLLM